MSMASSEQCPVELLQLADTVLWLMAKHSIAMHGKSMALQHSRGSRWQKIVVSML